MADYAALKKGGFMRQKQKNNFSLRIRVVGGHLDAKQLAKVAEVSEKYGEGYVHLTSRQPMHRSPSPLSSSYIPEVQYLPAFPLAEARSRPR